MTKDRHRFSEHLLILANHFHWSITATGNRLAGSFLPQVLLDYNGAFLPEKVAGGRFFAASRWR